MSLPDGFRMRSGQDLPAGQRMHRHRHAEAYAAVVISGEYCEAGDAGRYRVRPGDVLFHSAWAAHCDDVAAKGARVLNLPLDGIVLAAPAARIRDLDEIVRLAERDAAEAAALLLAEAVPVDAALWDWPDLLALALRHDPALSITDWAESQGLAAATVSRGFRGAFGVSPKRYRLEARTLAALDRLAVSAEPIAAVAADLGFADQAHLTRALGHITGQPPGAWRRGSNPFKTVPDLA